MRESLELSNTFGTYSKTVTIKVYHASDRKLLVKDIEFCNRREFCDFGPGFYLTANKRIAEEWAVHKPAEKWINVYIMTYQTADVLHLQGEDWIRVVLGNRVGTHKVYLKSNIVHGTITDDRLDISMPQFQRGLLSDKKLIQCLDYAKLGDQFLLRKDSSVLKDEKQYQLTGLEHRLAAERLRQRRVDIDANLKAIMRAAPIVGEKFTEYYEGLGDYYEV